MKPLTNNTIRLYGSLAFPLALIGYPLGIWLPRAYTTDLGIETAVVGLIITCAAVFDAFTDPAMGYGSDRLRFRWGRRRLWLGIGAPFLLLALYYLLNPAPGATALYLAFWFVFLRLGTTMVLVPYAAWGVELSGEYHTRTRIQSSREVFLILGLVGAALVPAIVERVHGDATTALDVLEAYTIPVLLLLPLLTIAVIARVPEPPPSPREGKVRLTRSLRLIARNGLFVRLAAIELLITGGEAFRNTLSVFFMEDVIGAPRVGMLFLVYVLMALVAIPAWDALARIHGKHRSLAAAMILVSIVSIAIFTLQHGQIWAFYALFAIKGFCFGAFAYLPRAMMADTIDLDTLTSGDARTGSYFAVYGFMTKLAQSIGGFSLVALSIVGYQTASNAVNTPFQLTVLGVLYAIVPTLAFLVALYLSWTWPLTGDRHARLQSLLERRNARLAARASSLAAGVATGTASGAATRTTGPRPSGPEPIELPTSLGS